MAAALPPTDPAAGASAPLVRQAPEVAQLRFLDAATNALSIPLQRPFEWDGEEVHAIDIRRLTVAEVGGVMLLYGEDDPIDVYDFLAAMSGRPAAVLRGLDCDDGTEVLARARPFLPRFVQPLLIEAAPSTASPTSSATGAALPSPPPAG